MSRMADMLVEIEDLYMQGYSAIDISEMSGIQLDLVMDAIRTYGATWVPEDPDEADPGEMDGDAASALASVGWGVDEDYVMDNDYFDDY